MTAVLDSAASASAVALPALEPEAEPHLGSRDPIERLEALCDPGSFRIREICDGAVSGIGKLSGATTVVFATDPRVQGGALGVDSCALIVRAYETASQAQSPIAGIWQSGGARLREGADGLHAVGLVFTAMTRASGKIPQLSLVVGPAAGGAAYGPALTDVVIMSPDARVFVTGPDVVRSVTGENLDAAALGGPKVHASKSGVAHIISASDEEAIASTRTMAALLARRPGPVSVVRDAQDPRAHLPESARRAYDVKPVIGSLLDAQFTELHKDWAPNVVTGFGRLHGQIIGVIANNPLRLGGCLTAPASDKAARFVRLCDAFGIPLLVLVDVPGYMPGSAQENDGIVRRGAKLLHAFAGASVPRVTVITRKAYGGAYIAMNSASLGATKVLAWPGAHVDVMNATAAVRVLSRRELAAAEAVSGSAGKDELEARLAAEHEVQAGGLDRAIASGLVDHVIEPIHTRDSVAAAIRRATAGRGTHSNIPL